MARIGLRLVERPNAVEASLWRRLRSDADLSCREHLFTLYVPFARAIAARERRRRPANGMERCDFEQLAFGGLLEAIDRYDPLQGAPFLAYAKHRIRGAVADGAARSSEASAQHHYRAKLEAERLSSLRAGQDPSRDALSELSELAALLAIGLLAEHAQQASVAETVSYERHEWRELTLNVVEEIELLPKAERSVMQHHYLNAVPFAQIAALLGLSKGRISQLHRAALTRLRERLRRFD